MKKSSNDLKKYQAITLDNGLRTLLIHDEQAAKSAAALAINVGHFHDPEERQGLAHFLEHMLFLGTEMYPDASEYQKFISGHGGSHNAWTGTEHTCFFFDIHKTAFEAALARFSQFFIAPLLSTSFVQKERQNIDAEFELKLKDDIRRLYDVHKETINPKHPFAQFSVGTIDTLTDRKGDCVSYELRKFFNHYYRASYMTLALEGPQSLKVLKALAEKMFSKIKTSNKPLVKIGTPLYLPEHQGIKINMCPIKKNHHLIISFAMESIDKYYKDKPESILTYLLGYEGKGSVLSLLKAQYWAMSLTAGSGINGSNFKDFNISIALTELGEAHIDDIIDIVFTYIALLKEEPLSPHYYIEKQKISELSFLYHEKIRGIDSVNQLVINMQHYPVEDYIFGDYIMSKMSDKNINKLLNYLTADNMRIIHISQNNHFDKTSFWYQVPYQVTRLENKKLAHWQRLSMKPRSITQWENQLHLPSENPYIITNPIMYKDENNKSVQSAHLAIQTTPIKLITEDGLSVWYKKDDTFKIPKGNIYIGIDSPYAIESVANVAMTRLFVDLYTETVIEEHYDAELAGIHYRLYAHQGGVTLQLSGMSEKQNILLGKLLASLKNHTINKQQFELFKKQLIKRWKNVQKSKSISQLFSRLSYLMQPNNPSSDALAAALDKTSFTDYLAFFQQVFQRINLEVLIHGNWLVEHAIDITNSIKKIFLDNVSAEYCVQSEVIDISKQQTLLLPLSLSEHDHATIVYTPMEKYDATTAALTMITSHLLSPLFFQKMRTEKQYGYLVGVSYVPINRYPGIAFYIQSPQCDSVFLVKAIDKFINHYLEELSDIDEKSWLQLTTSLASQLHEKDPNLRITSQRFWAAICNKDHHFQHKEQLRQAVLALSIDQVKNFIHDKVLPKNNPDRLILLSHKKSHAGKEFIAFNEQIEHELNGKIIYDFGCFEKKNPIKH